MIGAQGGTGTGAKLLITILDPASAAFDLAYTVGFPIVVLKLVIVQLFDRLLR